MTIMTIIYTVFWRVFVTVLMQINGRFLAVAAVKTICCHAENDHHVCKETESVSFKNSVCWRKKNSATVWESFSMYFWTCTKFLPNLFNILAQFFFQKAISSRLCSWGGNDQCVKQLTESCNTSWCSSVLFSLCLHSPINKSWQCCPVPHYVTG